MKIEYIDVHAHINFPDFAADREEVIKRAQENGTIIINVGTTLASSKEVLSLAENHEHVYAIVGLHPIHVACDHEHATPESDSYSHNYFEEFDYDEFEKLVAHPKTVGVGECGIDVFRLPENLDREAVLKKQEEDFRKQIELAVKYDKPIMIHARESYGKILEILDDCFKAYGSKLRGNAHFFVGSTQEAQAFLDRGFTVSFTGVITFAKQYKELVEYIPLESMLSETDCPFVAPQAYRGKRNEPLYVEEVVKKIAEIKNIDLETVKKTLLNNAFRQFNIKG
jgi:TatD DNase family protein